MGQIDVTSLLCDPDFVDPIQMIRRTPTVDNMGQNNIVEQQWGTIGCVQPASGKTIERLPDAMRVSGINSFWVKGTIRVDGSNQYPDIIIYKGYRYQVQTVMDWSSWGSGWAEGTCVREAIAP